MKQILSLFLYCLLILPAAYAQQVADSSYIFKFPTPRFHAGEGPVVWLDEGHYNFHTLDGRYYAFGQTVAAGGYRIAPNRVPFTEKRLKNCSILVIANALDSASAGSKGWRLPAKSAFSEAEIAAVQNWVKGGGSLFLIADHMPFPGAAHDLAAAFGVEYLNCFALDTMRPQLDRFFRSNGRLRDSDISRGLDTVITFTGSAFTLPKGAQPVLALLNFELLFPQVAWEFDKNTGKQKGEGTWQLGCLEYGKGRVVVSGEAAMFSAQLAGPKRQPMGMNHPMARENGRLLLQILAWLDRYNGKK